MAITPAPTPPDHLVGPDVPFPNLVARRIEVTQGMQNLANDMPLVADRRTYARVYVDVEGATTWANVTGGLEARRNGNQVGWIWPQNGSIVARSGGGERTNLDDSLQFRLPASWLEGQVTLTAFVFSYQVDTVFEQEPEADDNTTAVSVRFDEAQPLTIHLAPLHLHRSYHPTDVERIYEPSPGGTILAPGADAGALDRIVSGLYRYLPIASLNVDMLTGPIYPPNHSNGHEWDLGGDCDTTLVQWQGGLAKIDNWTVLMEDTDGVDVGESTVPDRDFLQVMDRTMEIDHFYRQADGSANVYGDTDGFGPTPIPGAPVFVYPCVIITDELHDTNEMLGLHRVFYDWADEREIFVGMMHPTLPAPFGGIATGGTDSITMKMGDGGWTGNPWWHSGAETIAHEAVHQAGLGHVPCKDEDGDGNPDEIDGGGLDMTHPMTLAFPDCRLAEVDEDGWYGFDVYWERYASEPTVLSNDPAASKPNQVYPLMSYLGPGWTDPFHWCRLLAYHGVHCSATALDLPWNPPNPEPDGSAPFAGNVPPSGSEPPPGTQIALVSLARGADDAWAIQLVGATDDPTPDMLELLAEEASIDPGAHGVAGQLEVRDRSGATTWSAAILHPDNPHGMTGGSVIAMAVPIAPGDETIAVIPADQTAPATTTQSGQAPTITDLRRDTASGDPTPPTLSWVAADPDGDTLSATVLYAPDGEHWQVLATDVVESSYSVETLAGLPSGGAQRYRVVVFDGFRAAHADIAADLPGGRNAPVVTVGGVPRGDVAVPLGATVVLEATAFDREDRGLSGTDLRWSSSTDGPLGEGPELRTDDLSAGEHVITVEATDSSGAVGRAEVRLRIDGSAVQEAPLPETETRLAAVFDALAEGVDPAPPATIVPAGDGSVPIPVIAIVGLIVLAVGATSVWIRVAQPHTSGAAVGGFRSVSGLAAENEVAEKPSDMSPWTVTHAGRTDVNPGMVEAGDDPPNG